MKDPEPRTSGSEQDHDEGGAETEAASAGPPEHDRTDVPRPEPGLTAPLHQVTEEEEAVEPAGVMPGAGPDEEPSPRREEIPEELPGEGGR